MYEKEIITNIVNCVALTVDSASDNEKGGGKLTKDDIKSLRSRSRDLLALLLTRGFPYLLVYVASRSSYEAFEKGLESNRCEDVINKIVELKNKNSMRDRKWGSEEVGYALYGALLVYTMKLAKMIPDEKKTFKDIIEYSLDKPSLNIKAYMIAEWIKRVVEAYTHK